MVRFVTVVLACFALLAAPARAVVDCPDARTAAPVLAGQGSLESVLGGPDGRLYFTDQDRAALLRLDAPGAEPVLLADGIEAPGGLLPGIDGRSLIVGYGNSFAQGAVGNFVPRAGLLSIDVRSGARTTVATGLSMANGLARDPAGVIYASDAAGSGIDRVIGDRVERNFATVVSANGLAVSADGRFLFANQTFQPAAVQRVDLTDPSRVQRYAAPGPDESAAGLDGLTIDQDDRLFAAANAAGEIWRIDTDGSICALARGLNQPSAVAFGSGGAFPVTSLYAVTFGGEVVEIPAARTVPQRVRAPRLRLRVRPRFLRVGTRSRVRVTVRRGLRLEPRARVRVGRQVKRTRANGRARFVVRPHRAGFMRLHARAAGVKPIRTRLRVLKRSPRPQGVVEP